MCLEIKNKSNTKTSKLKTMKKAKKLLKSFYKELQEWGAAAEWVRRN